MRIKQLFVLGLMNPMVTNGVISIEKKRSIVVKVEKDAEKKQEAAQKASITASAKKAKTVKKPVNLHAKSKQVKKKSVVVKSVESNSLLDKNTLDALLKENTNLPEPVKARLVASYNEIERLNNALVEENRRAEAASSRSSVSEEQYNKLVRENKELNAKLQNSQQSLQQLTQQLEKLTKSHTEINNNLQQQLKYVELYKKQIRAAEEKIKTLEQYQVRLEKKLTQVIKQHNLLVQFISELQGIKIKSKHHSIAGASAVRTAIS